MNPDDIRRRLGAPMVFNIRPIEVRERDGEFRALAVGYLDRGDIQVRLDDVMGPGGWSVAFLVVDPDKGHVECRLSLKIGDEWISRADIGAPGNSDDDNLLKGAYSDAFKRAATMWGIGRFLYDLGRQALPCRVWMRDGKPLLKDNKPRFDSWIGADPVGALIARAKAAGVPWAQTYDHRAKPDDGEPAAPPTETQDAPVPTPSAATPPMPSLDELMAHAGLDRRAVAAYCRSAFGKDRPSQLTVADYEQLLADLRAGKVQKSAASAA